MYNKICKITSFRRAWLEEEKQKQNIEKARGKSFVPTISQTPPPSAVDSPRRKATRSFLYESATVPVPAETHRRL